MTQQTELAPCPFCGAQAIGYAIEPHMHSDPLKALGVPDHHGSYVIEGNCECGSGLIGDDRGEVTARWNRRAAPDTQAQVVPDFYTACAPYQEGSKVDWIPLPGYSNETERGVENLVLEGARKEGYTGNASRRMMELGWEVRPVYLAAAPAAPVREPLAAETIMKIVMDVERQHHFFRGTTNWAVAVGRAIESAHGITAAIGKEEGNGLKT